MLLSEDTLRIIISFDSRLYYNIKKVSRRSSRMHINPYIYCIFKINHILNIISQPYPYYNVQPNV